MQPARISRDQPRFQQGDGVALELLKRSDGVSVCSCWFVQLSDSFCFGFFTLLLLSTESRMVQLIVSPKLALQPTAEEARIICATRISHLCPRLAAGRSRLIYFRLRRDPAVDDICKQIQGNRACAENHVMKRRQ